MGKLADRLDVAAASSSSGLLLNGAQVHQGLLEGLSHRSFAAYACLAPTRFRRRHGRRIACIHHRARPTSTAPASLRINASSIRVRHRRYPSRLDPTPCLHHPHAHPNGQDAVSPSSAVTRKDPPSPPVHMKPWSSRRSTTTSSRACSRQRRAQTRRPRSAPPQAYGTLAEVIWILRPFIYVLALRRWGRRATLPFALSFALEYLAKELRIRSFSPSTPAPKSLFATNPLLAAMMGQNPLTSILASVFMGGNPADKAKRPISTVEQAEWAKRGNSFWWYLLRGPLWYSFTRPRLAGVVDRTQGKF